MAPLLLALNIFLLFSSTSNALNCFSCGFIEGNSSNPCADPDNSKVQVATSSTLNITAYNEMFIRIFKEDATSELAQMKAAKYNGECTQCVTLKTPLAKSKKHAITRTCITSSFSQGYKSLASCIRPNKKYEDIWCYCKTGDDKCYHTNYEPNTIDEHDMFHCIALNGGPDSTYCLPGHTSLKNTKKSCKMEKPVIPKELDDILKERKADITPFLKMFNNIGEVGKPCSIGVYIDEYVIPNSGGVNVTLRTCTTHYEPRLGGKEFAEVKCQRQNRILQGENICYCKKDLCNTPDDVGTYKSSCSGLAKKLLDKDENFGHNVKGKRGSAGALKASMLLLGILFFLHY